MVQLLAEESVFRDLAVFAARLIRLDAGALVRIRRVDDERLALWCWTPLEMLALRGFAASLSEPEVTDITVRADALLTSARGAHAEMPLPPAQDLHWRGALPPTGGTTLETLDAVELERIVAAAEGTFREVSAVAAVPQRAGEALLDHVAVTVNSGQESVELSVRQLIAAARLGFLGDQSARVGRTGRDWVYLAAAHGVVYRSTAISTLTIR